MSNDNFNMPRENQAPLFLANRGQLLDVDGNYSLSLSPDSDGCNFNLSERPDSLPNNTASTEGPMLQPRNDLRPRLSTILETSHITALDNGSLCLWDEYFSELNNQDTDDQMNSAAPSPDSVGMSSCGTSCRGSMDLSLSSEEMLIRSNSFVLEEQAVPSGQSSLAESPAPPVFSHVETKSLLSPLSEEEGAPSHVCLGRTFEFKEKAELPCEENVALYSLFSPVEKDSVHSTFLLENSLADISSGEMVARGNSFILEEQAVASVVSPYEESTALSVKSHTESKLFLTPMCEMESANGKEGSYPCLGMTFVIGDNIELPNEENGSLCKSSLTMPGERPSLHATFLYENSPADFANDAQFIHSKAEILNETYSVETPARAITSNTPLCTVQDEDICTSTPLQNIGSNVPSLPFFAVSPCAESTGSPALQPVLRKRNPITPKQFEKEGESSSKVTKMEMSKFPKSDLNDVKCKRNAASSSGHTFGCFRPSSVRKSCSTPSPRSKVSKAVHNSPKRQNSEVKDQINLQESPSNFEKSQINSKTLAHESAAHCCPASPDAGEGTSSQANTDPKTHIANATFCYPKKSPQKRDTPVSKPTPEESMTDKINKVKMDSAVGRGKSACKTQNSSLCPSSETTVSRLLRMVKPQKLSPSLTFSKSKAEHLRIQSKPASQGNSSSRAETAVEATETNCRKVKKIGLVAHSKTLSTASCSMDANARIHGPLSPNQRSRASTSKAPAATPMTTTPLNKQRPGTSGRDNRATSAVGTPLSKQKSTGTTGETSLIVTPAAKTKPAPPQTTPRSSLMGPPLRPVPRPQQRKTSGNPSDKAKTTQVSGVAGRSATPFKVPVVKPKLTTTPAKTNAPVLTAACKSVPTTKGLLDGPISPPKRTTTAKLIRLSTPVDKSKPTAGAKPKQPLQSERGASRPQLRTRGARDVGNAGVTDGRIRLLQAQLAQSNHRFEALAVVLQQVLAQRDEAVRQSRGRSQELLELRGELMHTVNRSECLAQEKESLKASLQGALDEVRTQHQRDFVDLEQRLREEHQNETRAAQQQLREEQERSRERMQQQLEEISAAHETLRQEMELSHSRELQSARQQHQLSLQELKDVHAQDLLSLNKTLKDAEMVLNEKIGDLSQANAALMERLVEEENKNRDISQKDSHTLYLEQELESLKVVLDIKTEQLHQQEKKLMEVNKLMERNVKLGETLVKVQQENEDLKARMEKHAALSRQLSTEQAQLQESLQKESKVNKRLSMENEELLWKLHNGDLSSPRKSSPNPPSPFSLGSPRTPTLFSSPPVSPR